MAGIPQPSARRASLAVIFGIVFIDLVGFGIVIPILPLYSQRFGASPVVIGCLLSAYSLMQALCAPGWGRLSDRIGRRPVLFISLLGSAAGFWLMGIAHSLPLLFAARIIDGITGGNISTAQAYIADITPPEQRSRGMGLIGAAFGLGFIFGPAIGGLLSQVSPAAPFFFAAALAALNALAVALFLPESLVASVPVERPRSVGLWDLVRVPTAKRLRIVMVLYGCTTMAFSLLTATYPLFTHARFGYGMKAIGYIFAAQGIVGAIIQGGLLGVLLHWGGDRRLVRLGLLLLGASLFVLPLTATPAMLLAATAGIAVGHSFVAAPLNGMASKAVDAASQGRVLGLMQSAASLARIVGPVLGGWLLHYGAPAGGGLDARLAYWTAGALLIGGLGLSAGL